MKQQNKNYIIVWPDYDWCYPKDFQKTLSRKSDDYVTVTIPDYAAGDDDLIDTLVRDYFDTIDK